MCEVQELFEQWYLKEYEWHITKGRRGYRLDKDSNGNYTWEHPKHDFEVWKGAFSFMS